MASQGEPNSLCQTLDSCPIAEHSTNSETKSSSGRIQLPSHHQRHQVIHLAANMTSPSGSYHLKHHAQIA